MLPDVGLSCDGQQDGAGLYEEITDSPMWNANPNRRMWELYLRDGDHGTPQYAAPILTGNFAGSPPAYVEVEEFDCLHDEGIVYAQALSATGVPAQLEDMKGTCHGFDSFWTADISRTAVEKRIEALRRGFGNHNEFEDQ